jgi:hypothetical protein
MEYLTARWLSKEIKNGAPRFLRTNRLGVVVAGFLSEMIPDSERLWDWIKHSKMDRAINGYLAGNSVTLLCTQDPAALLDEDLSDAKLLGARFLNADLTRTKFANTQLTNVDLSYVSLSKGIDDAKIEDSLLGVWASANGAETRIPEGIIRNHLRTNTFQLKQGKVAMHVVFKCRSGVEIRRVRSDIERSVPVATAFYAEEIRNLFKNPDELRKRLFRTITDDGSD